MSGRSRPIDDRALDAFLRTLLAPGPDWAPDQIVEQAMAEVAVTRQARPRLAPLSARVGRIAPAWAAAGAVALAILIGVSLAIPSIGPRPSPSPSPTPTTSAELVLVSSPADGYQLLVPASWVEVASEHVDARKWVGSDGELMVSYGTSIFEDGRVTYCAPEHYAYITCGTITQGYSVPFDPSVDGVGGFSIESQLDRCDGRCPVTETDTTLDAEPALRSRAVMEGRQVTYVTMFHDRRPVIVYWSEPAESADEKRVEAMRAGFRFIDAPPTASATPFVDPTALVPFRNLADGYELLIPRFWGEGLASQNAGVQMFGSGVGWGTRGDPALTISIGEPDGSVFVCEHREQCELVTATTLDELDAGIISVPKQFQGAIYTPVEATGDLVLGGEAGRFDAPTYQSSGHGCLGCPGIRYCEYTFHGGRPVILAWDFWTLDFDRLGYQREITESFRFLR